MLKRHYKFHVFIKFFYERFIINIEFQVSFGIVFRVLKLTFDL